MVNQIKDSGADGLALQVTASARAADLVEENSDSEATYLADVRIYAFDHLLIVFDIDNVTQQNIAEIVSVVARDTESIYRAMNASVQIAGNGYQLQLPPASDAGFDIGDRAPTYTARSFMVISKHDGTATGRNSARLARDIVTMREEQLT